MPSRRVIGLTGAVWIDGDGDGKRTTPREQTKRLWKEARGEWRRFVPALANCDEAVTAQGAALLRVRGEAWQDEPIREAARKAGAHVKAGFAPYREAWRERRITRTVPK